VLRRLLLTSIFLSVTFPPMSVLAEDKPGDQQKMKLNEVEIHGELEKPKIFFILPKAKRDSESKQRQFRFYPDILAERVAAGFEEEARVLYQHGIPAE